MQITIENTELIKKNGRNGEYFQQIAFAHVVNPDGSPQRYPRQISLFPMKDANKKPIAYPIGDYTLSDSSFKVDEYGNLTLGFLNIKSNKK